MNLPCLYSFRRCPYAIRARMALVYSGIKVELREVKLSSIPSEMLSVSPKATVPVLHFPDGSLFEESLDIMQWALSVSDPLHWLTDEAVSNNLIEENDENFKPLLDAYNYADRFPQFSQLEHRNKAEYFLRLLETRLATHLWLNSDRLTLTDVALMPFIRQFAGVEPKWFQQCEYTELRRWLNRQIDSDLFKSVMHKVDFWQADDETVYLPN